MIKEVVHHVLMRKCSRLEKCWIIAVLSTLVIRGRILLSMAGGEGDLYGRG